TMSANMSPHGQSNPPQSQRRLNQASYLPNEVNASFLQIKKLSPRSSTTVWRNEVLGVLRPLGLDGLINLELPRPHESDEQYIKWRFWTPTVARWLLNQVDDTIQSHVKAQTTEVVRADTVYQTIRMVNSGNHRLYIERELQKWHNLKRSDFGKAADFIMAFQNQYNRLKIEEEEDPAGMALGRLLNEMQGEFLRITFIRAEVEGMDREIDARLFNYYCRLLISETRDFRDTDTGGGFDTVQQHGGGGGRGGGPGGSSGSFGGQEVSYRNWRRIDARQPR
ncbi:hypothetical protein LTR66_017554, partial [Elasticomyces elasticus]